MKLLAVSAGGRAIPKRFTCDGADVSPPLRWKAPPPRARGLALLVVDVSTPGPFVHWLAWGVSPRSRRLAAGARPPRQGRNDFGRAVRRAGVLGQKLLVGTYLRHA